MTKKIVIVDYGMGNLHSVKKRVIAEGGVAIVSSDPKLIREAQKIILPGVGHFFKAMQNLKKMNLIKPLTDAVVIKKTPVLGICLGMQLMANHSEEGNVNGLGWLNANVKKLNPKNKLHFKVPHTGWNTIKFNKESLIFKDLPPFPEFYFVHSYYLYTEDETIKNSITKYESEFVSSVQKDNIYGVQYHPEKSHRSGSVLIKNFISI